MSFSGAQDEHGPLGRLFQSFQQRVEGFAGNLMRFVDDEDFIAIARRPVAHVFAQLAHFIDAAIRCRIDLDDIGRIAARDFQATGAHPAGRRRRTIDAIQAASQNAGDRGFTGPALARKDVAMRDALLRDGVFKRSANVLLADQLRKRLRPVFPGDDLVHGKISEYRPQRGMPDPG